MKRISDYFIFISSGPRGPDIIMYNINTLKY